MILKFTILLFAILSVFDLKAQGIYQNPVIHADYSDPDVIRVGDDYYMVSSSFNHVPGLPILHSKDLVNWRLIGYALKKLVPEDHFKTVRHGGGVWAPSIRYHNSKFHIYYPDPDFGIYLITAKNINGPWTEPLLVESGKGLIDPCPLWDTDGNTYLVHAFAGSRAGIKSILMIKKMNAEGTKVIDEGRIVYDGHEQDPTIEGPKIYKRNGYYYVFAPAGGVSTGWQVVLRSKNIYGPYERKIVLEQGKTAINGPHQGGWVDTKSGEHWFIHFQEKDAYGRIVHLQPMRWASDWPVMGVDNDGNGIGEPLIESSIPKTTGNSTGFLIPQSDEFNSSTPGPQWQWQANVSGTWYYLTGTAMRLYSFPHQPASNNFSMPNLYMQKFPAEKFSAVTKMKFSARQETEKAGMIIHGTDYAYLALVRNKDFQELKYVICEGADKGREETTVYSTYYPGQEIYFKVSVTENGLCEFSYSSDGNKYTVAGKKFRAKPGKWVGAKMGIFCTRSITSNDSGSADFDWFRVEKL